jgi:hypothetical protein
LKKKIPVSSRFFLGQLERWSFESFWSILVILWNNQKINIPKSLTCWIKTKIVINEIKSQLESTYTWMIESPCCCPSCIINKNPFRYLTFYPAKSDMTIQQKNWMLQFFILALMTTI